MWAEVLKTDFFGIIYNLDPHFYDVLQVSVDDSTNQKKIRASKIVDSIFLIKDNLGYLSLSRTGACNFN